MTVEAKCELCGKPMPPGEEMFKYHGHSGPCPTSPDKELADALKEADIQQKTFSNDMIRGVMQFHDAFGHPVRDTPSIPPKNRILLRKDLVNSEHTELMDAIDTNNLVEIADGIADLIYVLIGTALEYGIPLAMVFAEVQRSNMSKLGPDGKPIYNDIGKVVKPTTWSPPDIRGIIYDAMMGRNGYPEPKQYPSDYAIYSLLGFTCLEEFIAWEESYTDCPGNDK